MSVLDILPLSGPRRALRHLAFLRAAGSEVPREHNPPPGLHALDRPVPAGAPGRIALLGTGRRPVALEKRFDLFRPDQQRQARTELDFYARWSPEFRGVPGLVLPRALAWRIGEDALYLRLSFIPGARPAMSRDARCGALRGLGRIAARGRGLSGLPRHVGPEIGGPRLREFRALLAQHDLAEAAEAIGRQAMSPAPPGLGYCHGDATTPNILTLGGGRTLAVDWTHHGLAPPGRDPARFLQPWIYQVTETAAAAAPFEETERAALAAYSAGLGGTVPAQAYLRERARVLIHSAGLARSWLRRRPRKTPRFRAWVRHVAAARL